MFHVTAVQGFGTAATARPVSLFDVVAQVLERAAHTSHAGLGALASDWAAFLAASAARRKTGYVDPTKAVYCSVPDRSGNYRPECRANSASSAARDPARALQRAVDAFLNAADLKKLTGQALEIRLPDGGTKPGVPIPEFPESPLYAIGGGYDGVIGTGTMQFATAALLIAGALSFPPAAVVPAFLSPTQLTFALAAADIAAFLNSVAANFPALLAAYKERGRVPAADVLVPETVVVLPEPAPAPAPAPQTAAPKSNVGILVGLAAVGLAITIGGSYAAARARRQEHAADADFSPAFGLGQRPRAYGRGASRAYRGGAAW